MRKATTLATLYDLEDINGLRCNHLDRHRRRRGDGKKPISSRDLARYPRRMMQRLAQGIMDKAADGVQPQRVMVSPKATTPQPIVRPEEVVDRPERLHSSDHKQADGIQMVRIGFRERPLRDGAGKISPGRLAPTDRQLSDVAEKGREILQLMTDKWNKYDLSTAGVDKNRPFEESTLEDIRHILQHN